MRLLVMNSIHECDRLERLERALLVLEGLTYLQDDEDPFATEVYEIAHAALGFCCSPKEWLNLISKHEDELKKANIMDVEKILNRGGVAQLGEQKAGSL